jgi:hypothetical protein
MAVLIDPPLWPAHGRLWSHLVSDVSFDELHAFARATGLPARGFEGDHYDVPQERYGDLVAAGAEPVGGRELLRRLAAAGLRRQKRRGERVVASRGSGPVRVDAVLGTRFPVHPVTAVRSAVTAVGLPGHLLLVTREDRAQELPRSGVDAGGDPHLTAGELLRGLLPGAPAADLQGVQVGTLVAVPGRTAELVLRHHLPFVEARPPARWVPGGARLLPPEIEALLHAGGLR